MRETKAQGTIVPSMGMNLQTQANTSLRGVRPAGSWLEDDDRITPRLIWKTIRLWSRVAGPIALLLTALSVIAVWHFVKPKYRASAWIHIEDLAPYVVKPTEFYSERMSMRFVETQIELIRSPLVLAPVVSKPEVLAVAELRDQDNPLVYLSRKLDVAGVGKSQLYEVRFLARDPHESALVVNAVMDSYFRIRQEDASVRSQRVIELLEQEKERRAREVERLRGTMRELGQELYGAEDFRPGAGQAMVLSHPLHSLRERLSTTEVERRVLEAQLKANEELVQDSEIEVSALMVELELNRHPSMQRLRAQISATEAEMDALETASARGKNDPAYRRSLDAIERLQRRLAETRAEVRPKIVETVTALAEHKRSDALRAMRSKVEGLLATEKSLTLKMRSEIGRLNQTGNKSLEFEFARAELVREEDVYDQIANRALTMKAEMRAPARVEFLKRAEPPATPVEKLPWRQMLIAGFASLFAPFALALIWERSVRRVRDTRELSDFSQLGVLGEVAKLPTRMHRLPARNGRRSRDLSVYQESIDHLRTSITLADDQETLQVISVGSAVMGEGKTSVAAQLAISLARSTDSPTLLIDADLRSPELHRVFRLDLEPGLAQVLDGECDFQDALVKDWSDTLHILPAGRLHRSPHKLMGGGAWDMLLKEARATYRYVVIDTPPILSASEALVVARASDGNVLCTMRDYSRGRQIQQAVDRLTRTGARPLGAVLNGVATNSYQNAYGNYPYVSAHR